MKNASSILAASMVFFFGFQVSLSAQKPATWRGGVPGRSTDWTCAANWMEGHVPNEFSDVLIPDVATVGGFRPVIRSAAGGINSLTVLSGAQLRIETGGSLVVFEFLDVIANGIIQNNGRLQLPIVEDKRAAHAVNRKVRR